MNSLVKVFYIIFILTSCIYHSGQHKDYLEYSPLNQGNELKKSSLNKVIKDLSFFPINGLRFRLSELKNIKAIVLVMRDKNCPISEQQGSQLAYLEKEYSNKDVKFIYNYVGQVKPQESAKEDLERFGFKDSYVIDSRQKVINALGAKTTGDIFILTPERRVIYKGSVDYRGHSLMTLNSTMKNHYILDSLSALISGKKITPKELPTSGCIIPRPIIKKTVFYKDVAPIIKKKCTSCHNPLGTGPMNFISYEDISGRGAMFKYVLENDLMPPWYVAPNTGPWKNNISLTLKERAMLLKWVEMGFPKKDRSKREHLLQSAKQKTKKSRNSADYIIRLPEDVLVPADGLPQYKNFVIQTSFKEDKWIRSVNFFFKPKVVHHIDVFVMDSSYEDVAHSMNNFSFITKAINFFTSTSTDFRSKHATTTWPIFNTSLSPSILSSLKDNKITYNIQGIHKEAGILLPRNSKLIVSAHYEPIGQEVIDDYTHVQINFYKKKKPKYEIVTLFYSPKSISIPPYASNHKVEMSRKMEETRTLVGLFTHMHYRGKASDIFIIDPEGNRKRIFGIDPWTITFERVLLFKKPLLISKGSIIKCINWFDNSTKNQLNPAPEKYVNKGLFFKDEMSNCYFQWLIPSNQPKHFLWKEI